MPTCREIVSAKNFSVVLQVLGILGAFGSGSFALYILMWFRPDGMHAVRMFVAYIYITMLAMLIPSAELGLMKHPHLTRFTRFIQSHIGRAFVSIFIGGLFLGQQIGGWIVGIYMIALGILNIFATCTTGDHREMRAGTTTGTT